MEANKAQFEERCGVWWDSAEDMDKHREVCGQGFVAKQVIANMNNDSG